MTYKKITQDVIQEVKDPVVVEHKKEQLEEEKAKILANKEVFLKECDTKILALDEMLKLFI